MRASTFSRAARASLSPASAAETFARANCRTWESEPQRLKPNCLIESMARLASCQPQRRRLSRTSPKIDALTRTLFMTLFRAIHQGNMPIEMQKDGPDSGPS